MFTIASRLKFRYTTPQGLISTEDLWDLPLTATNNRANLDDIAKGLSRQVKALDTEESFVVATKTVDTTLQLKLDIVKHIIAAKIVERDAATKARENKARKQQLTELLHAKRNENLAKLSEDEIAALIAGIE